METLQLANEQRTEFISLIDGPIYLEGGFDFTTPDISGVFTHEPYGAQFDPSNFEPHTETFQVTMKGATDAVLHELDRLQDFLENVRMYGDQDIAIESSWLEWGARGENLKRSLLYSGSFQVTSRDDVTPGLSRCTILGVLSLTRHPLWEAIDHEDLTTSNLSCLGGQHNYTNLDGNVPARIAHVGIGTAVAGVPAFTEVWVGIRKLNQGVTGFVPVWDCTVGTNLDPAPGDTAIVVDATAYGGNKFQTVFTAWPTMLDRFMISPNDVAVADWSHFQGRYLVLARCKVNLGGTVGVVMEYGMGGPAQEADEVYMDHAAWQFVPLGNISIPPWRGEQYGTDVFTRYFVINIRAEVLTAPAQLDMDCFVLMPNEYLLYVDSQASIWAGTEATVDTREDDTDLGYFRGLAWVDENIAYAPSNWYVPPDAGSIVVAVNNSILTDTIYLDMDIQPRWTLYRSG